MQRPSCCGFSRLVLPLTIRRYTGEMTTRPTRNKRIGECCDGGAREKIWMANEAKDSDGGKLVIGWRRRSALRIVVFTKFRPAHCEGRHNHTPDHRYLYRLRCEEIHGHSPNRRYLYQSFNGVFWALTLRGPHIPHDNYDADTFQSAKANSRILVRIISLSRQISSLLYPQKSPDCMTPTIVPPPSPHPHPHPSSPHPYPTPIPPLHKHLAATQTSPAPSSSPCPCAS